VHDHAGHAAPTRADIALAHVSSDPDVPAVAVAAHPHPAALLAAHPHAAAPVSSAAIHPSGATCSGTALAGFHAALTTAGGHPRAAR